MTEPYYTIEEVFNPKEMSVSYIVISLGTFPEKIRETDDLEEAKECVRMLRKYKNRVFHYVEDSKLVDEPKMKSFNINSTIKVKLTKFGEQMLEKEHNEFWERVGRLHQFPYENPKGDGNGYTEFQLFALMEKLGAYCGPGREMPFETTILIDEKDLGIL